MSAPPNSSAGSPVTDRISPGRRSFHSIARISAFGKIADVLAIHSLQLYFWINNSETMDALMKVKMKDRQELLAASTDGLLGMIMRLNRRPHYHNTLDAIALTSRLMELRERDQKIGLSLSSPKDTVPS